MSSPGSVRERNTISPLLALAAVLLGLAAMRPVTLWALPLGMRTALVLAELALVAPGLVALAASRVPWQGVLGRWPLDRRMLGLMVVAGGSLWLASLGLLELQYVVWSPPPGYLEAFQQLHEALRPKNAADALVSLATIALIPAVCEETLVRGIVLPSLLRPASAGGAIVISAVVFAGIHLDPYRTLFTLVLGLALGFLRVRTGSLAASMTAHAALNALTFALAPFVEDPSQGLPEPRPLLGLALFLAGAAATTVSFRLVPSLTRSGEAPRLDA